MFYKKWRELNAFQRPVSLLRALNDVLALFRQLWLAAVADSVGKVDGLVDLAGALALAGLDALGLLELLLDRGGLGELLGMDGLGDVAPEGQGLVGCLHAVGGNDLGGDLQRGSVDDGELLLSGDSLLQRVLVAVRRSRDGHGEL